MRKLLTTLLAGFMTLSAFATGEPSTYFQIYVPPNNDPVRRDASLIITAIYDSTYFEIVDDGADGDTDDSKTGYLMAGQSYVLYIRDNGINDDARYASGGVLKWDGDYFIVRSDKLVFASQSTNSDWQHDWVPSTDKKSIGRKFILYSPPFTSSKRDVNVFAYEANTTVTFQKISFQPKTNTGFTDVNFENATTLFSRTLNPGEDIIYKYTNGRDAMEAGETYLILADKPVTVQYGALFGNERDGGGYVPSSNGSSSGELFYFGVPYQSAGEQEIRIVSWDDANAVQLERYVNGNWVTVKSFSLNKMKAGDWVGRNEGNLSYANTFRLTCTPGKRVSVFEGNWFETGSPGTSDMATMVSSENETTSGLRFLTYMAPPGNEQNVVDPFTNKAFGQQLTHLYLFAKEGATVTVKDAYTNGNKFKKTFTIAGERYADCALTLSEWKNIYNGTGTTAGGPERPYLLVESDRPISVMNTNFNDNWMAYTGTSLGQSFTQETTISQQTAIPADTVVVTSLINTGSGVDNPRIEVQVQDGLKVVGCKLKKENNPGINGNIEELPNKTVVTFDTLSNLQPQTEYRVETEVVASVGNNSGTLVTSGSNSTIETIVTGSVNGQIQQSSSTQVVNINTNNTSNLIFSRFTDNLLTKDSTDSWTISWVDINNDGYDDVFATDRRSNKPNLIYMNNKSGGFTRGQSLIADSAISISNSWADINNDGFKDLLVMNNTRKPNVFYENINGVLTKKSEHPFTQSVSYYHGGAFGDYDNDGKADLFLCNYFPTKYNELYRNNGTTGFVKELSNTIPAQANQSIGPSWADYDGDGFLDLFVPNGNGFTNSLFHNEGNGRFTKAQNAITAEGGQSVGSCWGDYDNDKDLDLFVTNSNAMGNFLYRNEGDGRFTKITTGVAVTDKANSHGCSFADIDNDGDLDLYVSNDKNFKLLYINDGHGGFTKKEDEVVCFNYGNAYGHAWSDFDRDGDLDLIVATHSNQPNALFTNNGNSHHWIEVGLKGTVSNASAIGARISVYADGKWQIREVNSQSGFGGQSSYIQHFGLGQISLVDSLIIQWPSGIRQVLTQINSKQILNLTEPASTLVNGAVFHDQNDNGVRESDEPLLGQAVIQIAGGDSRIYTNQAGYFQAALTEGNYTVRLVEANGIRATSNTSHSVQVVATQQPDTIWVPAVPTCNGTDLQMEMGSTAIRKGFSNNQFLVSLQNNGREWVSQFRFKLKLPALLQPGTPNQPWETLENLTENGQAYRVYSWAFRDLAPFEGQLIQFQHATGSAAVIGDTLRISGWIETAMTDCNLSDNQMTQTYKVVGAIDPNDLQVSPVGYGPQGYIQKDQVLTYTIRFQNLGNHPAASVTIRDLLPAGLDPETIKLVASSHPDLYWERKGQDLLFQFPDIFLPDSASNPAGSEGYLMFSVSPRVDILAGTVIRNRASIQFDHYETIETNETINTIQSKQQEESMIVVKSWPNPAADVVYLSLTHKMGKYTNKRIRRVELVDLNGRTVLNKPLEEDAELRLELPAQARGLYLVKLTDSEGEVYTHKIFVQKER